MLLRRVCGILEVCLGGCRGGRARLFTHQTRPMQGVGLAARTPHAHLTPISIVFLLLTGAQQMLSCLCVCMCCVT